MEREQFTFYVSFARAGRRIKKVAERCAFYDAVIDYALDGKLPDLDSVPESVGMAMELVLPVLTSSRNKAANRINKTKQTGTNENKPEQTKNKSLGEQTANEKEKEKEGEREEEREKENECSISPPTPSSPAPAAKPKTATGLAEEIIAGWSEPLQQAFRDWLAYKREKKQTYKEVGLRALLNQVRKNADESGDAAVIEAIHNSMASGYQGIIFDRLKAAPAQRNPKYMTSGSQKPLSSADWDDLLDKI